MTQLRGKHPVTPLVTPETLAVTQVTRLRHVHKRSHVQARARNGNVHFSRERHQTTCNRVTHVTTGISGVTVRVTNTFPRNHKGFETVKEDRNERAAWVNENLPACAAVAAAFKAEFGDVRLVFASQNGHTIGQRSPDGIPLSETLLGPIVTKRKGAGNGHL